MTTILKNEMEENEKEKIEGDTVTVLVQMLKESCRYGSTVVVLPAAILHYDNIM